MSEIGIELELGILLGLLLVGPGIFAVFEVETAAWRKILKGLIVIGLTLGLYGPIGHWAAVVPVVLAGIGSTYHWVWCRKKWNSSVARHAAAPLLPASRLGMA